MFVLVFTKILKMLQYFRHPLYSRVEGILINPGWNFFLTTPGMNLKSAYHKE